MLYNVGNSDEHTERQFSKYMESCFCKLVKSDSCL